MTLRKPIVLIDGNHGQLPAGDALPIEAVRSALATYNRVKGGGRYCLPNADGVANGTLLGAADATQNKFITAGFNSTGFTATVVGKVSNGSSTGGDTQTAKDLVAAVKAQDPGDTSSSFYERGFPDFGIIECASTPTLFSTYNGVSYGWVASCGSAFNGLYQNTKTGGNSIGFWVRAIGGDILPIRPIPNRTDPVLDPTLMEAWLDGVYQTTIPVITPAMGWVRVAITGKPNWVSLWAVGDAKAQIAVPYFLDETFDVEQNSPSRMVVYPYYVE